jgi:hypothetical protein
LSLTTTIRRFAIEESTHNERMFPLASPRTRAQVLRTLCRLAETQQNLPVPLTAEERSDLREAFRLLTLYRHRFQEPA